MTTITDRPLRLLRALILVSLLALVLAGCSSTDQSTGAAGEQTTADDDQETAPADPQEQTETLTLEWATGVPLNALQMGQDVQRFVDEVERQTDGRIQFNLHPGDSLVPHPELLDALDTGVTDVASVIGATFPTQFSMFVETAIHDMERGLEWSPVNQVELTRTMLDEFPEFEQQVSDLGFKLLFLHPLGAHMLMTNEPVTQLQDIDGLRVRTYGTSIPTLIETAGGVPTDMPASELYTATQTDAVQGAYTAPDFMLSISYHEVADQLAWIGEQGGTSTLLVQGSMALIREEAWEQLTEEEQQIVEEVGREVELWAAEQTVSATEAAVEGLTEAGVQVNELPDEDIERWQEALPDQYGSAAESLNDQGLPGEEFIEVLLRQADEMAADS